MRGTMAEPRSRLHLPSPGRRPSPSPPQSRRLRRRRSSRWRQAAMGVLLGAAGAGILMVLMRIPERLDTLLLVSTAIANLISGLSRLSIGVLQLTGVMVVVLVTLFALMLLVGGGMRLLRAVAPRPGKTP